MRLSPAVLSLLSVGIAGLVASAVWLTGLHIDCSSRWKDSGLRAHYRDGTCLVEAGSRWVPERAIRIHVREPG
jgi:hypothetical protein